MNTILDEHERANMKVFLASLLGFLTGFGGATFGAYHLQKDQLSQIGLNIEWLTITKRNYEKEHEQLAVALDRLLNVSEEIQPMAMQFHQMKRELAHLDRDVQKLKNKR